ncbi:DUF4270 domain-containing protein [uncultured Kordia sp.]|uniref:DUF4270 domain-containing protein n=1 Tax=uncultured Kordia sp. TaxID=507699 RepID=UPI002610A77F|nr:DUF4270 domain-containing protein [uncultured Kordia sp.]
MKKTLTSASVVLLILVGFIACDDEFSTVGGEIIENNNFTTNLYDETVLDVSNRRMSPVQTNGLPVYQLGKNINGIYGDIMTSLTVQANLVSGNENPEFGEKTQEEEDADATDLEEEEEVTKVYLNIPYFSNSTVESDGSITTAVDSVYGDRTVPFLLTVKEFTYFLRSVDEDGNQQAYYSDEDFSSFTGQTLFQGDVLLSEDQVEVTEIDNETGEEVVVETLSPRLRVELDTQFFQERIIDNEGSIKLSNNNVFRAEDLFRGLHISIGQDSNLLMLLDFQNADIVIEYQYKKLETQGNDDPDDDDIIVQTGSYALSLSSGNIVNTFTPLGTFPDVEASNDNIYLKGGQGSMAVLDLFGPDNDNNGIADQLEEIREENWIINDANLVFHINESEQGSEQDPQRIYLYNMDDNIPLEDYDADLTVSATSPGLSKILHGGILERDESGEGVRYKIRLTEHINNLVRKDSTNKRLGLVSSSDIRIVTSGRENTGSSEQEFIPTVSNMNPFGTVLYGNTAASPADKRLTLEIFYTIPETN